MPYYLIDVETVHIKQVGIEASSRSTALSLLQNGLGDLLSEGYGKPTYSIQEGKMPKPFEMKFEVVLYVMPGKDGNEGKENIAKAFEDYITEMASDDTFSIGSTRVVGADVTFVNHEE